MPKMQKRNTGLDVGSIQGCVEASSIEDFDGESYQDWDKEKWRIVHSDEPIDMKGENDEPTED